MVGIEVPFLPGNQPQCSKRLVGASVERDEQAFRQRDVRILKPAVDPLRSLYQDGLALIERDAARAVESGRRGAGEVLQLTSQMVPPENTRRRLSLVQAE